MANATPLLYSEILPLDARQHVELGLRTDINFDFARTLHATPVNMIEFPQICHHYPIVFSPDAAATPIAILGLVENESLMINDQGQWDLPGAYVPAYIRRYPFLLAEITDTDQLTLCIDNTPHIVNSTSPEKFFQPDGTPSALTNHAMDFCKSFHAATLQTRDFSKALINHNLLSNREAEIPLPNGRRIQFGGFQVIDEKKWVELPDAILLEWRQKGWLPAVYAALFSGVQWHHLARLYAARHLP